ncbi:MAG: PD40 domain-containing protein, partial [Leptospira sp.]|nr:PD40 domain-containing protein [Leptospira sp.]
MNQCAFFKTSVKIKPIPFDYQAIGNNYFNPQNDKPFPLTIQRGNNLYNSTSKDGKFLFYATDKDGNFDIWFRDLNSSIVVPVTQHPSQEYKPAISPDGTKLVFVSEQYDSEGDLVLLNMEPEKWVQSAIRGKRFINQNFRVLTNPDWKNQNSQQRVIDTDPTWMPDGEKIIFSSDRFSPGIQNLVMMEINSGKMKNLTSQGGSSPFVSGDGKKIYFLSYRDSEYGEIYSLELSSGNVSRITNNYSLDFSPSVSKDNRYLYYTSIREDTNGNGVLDERDKSYIVQKDLSTNKEKFLTSGDNSVFDTKYSEFNGGSILFSASLYNSINIYFIPYSGSVPRQEGIVEQFNFALEYRTQDSQSRYFLALDSVELFFDKDPLFPIYQARVQSKKIEYLLSKNKTKEARQLISDLKEEDNPMSVGYSYFFEGKINSNSNKYTGKQLTDLAIDPNNGEQLNAALLHLRSEWEESNGRYKDLVATLESIQSKYPNYHLIRDVRNKYGNFEFKPDSIKIPKFYTESILAYEELMAQESEIIATRKHEVNDILKDLHTKILMGKTPEDVFKHVVNIQNLESNPKNSVILNQFLEYIKAENLRNRRNINESLSVLDRLIPIPENLELYPLGQKSIFETDYYIRLYRNPALSYIHFLKYKNAQDLGDNSTALRHLQIFMEFYDPIISPDIKSDELTYLFLYWENKAIEYERMGDLQQAAFHYYFNNLGMALAKSKNLSEEKFYGNYAVYYQRKMIDTIFQYGRSLREKEEAQILNRINILGEDNLDILGNLSDLMSFVQSIPLLDALKILGDFRDLRKKDVIHENALQLSDLYFNYHLEKNRPYLNLAVAYGHAYYLINRSVINETALYERGEMTESKKLEILENYKKAEYELRWILFSDPTFPDAYQLLGWLLQYVDIIKAKRIESKSQTEEERYESAYQRYFPDKNFEENVELYAQILEFLGKEYPNKKILSDINLNLGNNYFLLSNYPRSNESGEAVENYGKFIVSKAQFDDYRQEAVFHYNYGRSSLYRGNYTKAIEQFELVLNIYTKNEYYQSLGRVGDSRDSIDLASNSEFIEVKGKLALINGMIALSYMEMGKFEESIAPMQQALSHNRISKNLNELNLWNSLAISYQKTGRFKESESILNRAKDSFVEESDSIQSWSFSIADQFWGVLLPDNIRVMGDGRFPGEFPLPFKNLLTQSIEINNHIEKKDYKKALLAIDNREKYISSRRLKKWVMGNLVTQKTYALRGQIYYDSGDYYNAYLEFQKMEEAFRKSGDLSLERTALVRKSNSVFAYSENLPLHERGRERWKKILNENQSSLIHHRDRSIKNCEANMNFSLCREKFRKDFLRFDITLGLNYFYLGELYKTAGDLHLAFLNYGLALSLLENPGNIDPNIKLLSKDPIPRRMRIRNMLNVARIHIRLGDLRKANSYLKEASEYAYEFRLEKELFVADLVKLELTSFGGYQPNSSKSRDIKSSLTTLDKKISTEESILWELPSHILEEVVRTSIDYSIKTNRPWDVPPIRDIHRQRKTQKDVILSSLEFSNLELDKATKDYRNILTSILKNQREIENRAIARSKIGNLLREKEKLRASLINQTKVISQIDKNYSGYYSEIKYNSSSLKTGDSLVRCYDNGNGYSIWRTNSSSRTFDFYPRSARKELIESIIHQNDKNLFLNPDNCSFLYRHASSKSNGKIQLITKDSDAHKSKIRDGIDWRWRTVLVSDKKLEDETRLKFSNSENLDYRLLDTDVLFVTNSLLEDRFPVFTYKGMSSLNLRELFTNRSEIATIVLEVEDLGRWDWENINRTWDLARAGREKNLIITKKLTNQERRLLKRNQLPEDSLVFGILPNKISPTNPLSRYRELRSAAVFEERAKNFNSAYDLYYDAGSFLSDEKNEILENDIDLARMKRKIFPNKDPDYFYKPLFREYKSNEIFSDILYTKFLIDCFSDRTIETNRAQ